jgi:hypothetical protein
MGNKNKKWGIVSDKNQPCVPFDYDAISKLEQSVILKKDVVFCLQNNKWGLVDLSGKEIIPFTYDNYGYIYKDGQRELVIFTKNTPNSNPTVIFPTAKYGAVDYSNNIIVPFIFDSTGQLVKHLYDEKHKNK